MADIREEINLVDGISPVLDKVIAKMEKAQAGMDRMSGAANALGDAATAPLTQVSGSLTKVTDATKDATFALEGMKKTIMSLLAAGASIDQVAGMGMFKQMGIKKADIAALTAQVEQAATAQTEAMTQAGESAQVMAEETVAATTEAADAFTESTGVMESALTQLEAIGQQWSESQQAIWAQFEEGVTQAQGAYTAGMEAMIASTETMEAAVVPAIAAVPSALSEIPAVARMAGDALANMGNKGGNSFGYMGRMMSRMLLYFAAFKLFQMGVSSAKEGMEQDALAKILHNRLGDKFTGMQGGIHTTAMNTPFSELSQYKGLETFSTVTNNPATLQKLLGITRHLAEIDPQHRGYDNAMNALRTMLDTGRGMSLQSYGFQRGALAHAGQFTGNAPGTAKHPLTRNIGTFADEMIKAMSISGMTNGVADAQLNTPQGKFETFANKGATAMRDLGKKLASVFADVLSKLSPLVDKFDKWVNSQDGVRFFSDLKYGIEKFLDASVATFKWLHDNWPWLNSAIWTVVVTLGIMKGSVVASMGLSALSTAVASWGALRTAIMLTNAAAALPGIAAILGLAGLIVGGAWKFGQDNGEEYRYATNEHAYLAAQHMADGKARQKKFGLSPLEKWQNLRDVNYFHDKLFNGSLVDNVSPPASVLKAEKAYDALVKMGRVHSDTDKMTDTTQLGASSAHPMHTTVDKPINLAKEDIKMLENFAERKFIAQVNVTTLAPNIHTEVHGGGGMDAHELSRHVAHELSKQIQHHTKKAPLTSGHLAHAAAH